MKSVTAFRCDSDVKTFIVDVYCDDDTDVENNDVDDVNYTRNCAIYDSIVYYALCTFFLISESCAILTVTNHHWFQ